MSFSLFVMALLIPKMIKWTSGLSLLELALMFCGCTSAIEVENHDYYSIEELTEIGRINAVKKARQMTDIEFIPKGNLVGNGSLYTKGSVYHGVVYSSVKEIGSFVGSNVSFHTFMTAINNPRSKIYTDRLDEPPYNGSNCGLYYGTVCSALVSYSLGLVPIRASYDFPCDDSFQEIEDINPEKLEVADILWGGGHVALITEIQRDSQGMVRFFEVSESSKGTFRTTYPRDYFYWLQETWVRRVYRYKNLYKNTEYLSASEFVAVCGEDATPYSYNNDICADKGDEYCYFEGEDVVLNVFVPYHCVELKKDGKLYSIISNESGGDVTLHDLPYGKYCARLIRSDGSYSDSTSWIVLNYNVAPDPDNHTLYFSSRNATPESMNFALINGGRKYPASELFYHLFTDEEIQKGIVIVPEDKIKPECSYFSITFRTEYGRISLRPQKWFDS